MELGSHALSHPDLRLLDGRELAFELRESKAAVEQLTGRSCRTLSYPYGLYDERVTEAAAEAGYELAFVWLPGPCDRWQRRGSPLPRGTALSASPSSWQRTEGVGQG
jgi:peptidoglycan/xylan/chitin deacetylase (PgdA/CDA1 family)